MSRISANKTIPGSPTHPGFLIKEEIEAREMKQKDLATAMGISVTVLSELINGRRNVTAGIALKLEKALDIPAIFWMDYQAQHDLDILRKAETVL